MWTQGLFSTTRSPHTVRMCINNQKSKPEITLQTITTGISTTRSRSWSLHCVLKQDPQKQFPYRQNQAWQTVVKLRMKEPLKMRFQYFYWSFKTNTGKSKVPVIYIIFFKLTFQFFQDQFVLHQLWKEPIKQVWKSWFLGYLCFKQFNDPLSRPSQRCH